MTQRSRSASCRTAAAWLVAAVLGVAAVSFTAAAAPEKEDKEDKAEETKKQSAAKKPRVITNADLEKYGKRTTPARGKAVTQPTAPYVLPEAQPPEPARTTLPPEDRLDGSSLPELEERQTELQELLTYLKAKVAWIKNPLLKRLIPPDGEKLLDPSLGPGQELQLTRSRVFAVEGRLGKIRLLIQSGGSAAPVLQP